MKETRLLMGMPVTVEILDHQVTQKDIDSVFAYFTYIDEKFSTYKQTSEISKINRRELPRKDWSQDMADVLLLCDKTKRETGGYFDIINEDGLLDPSGLVKGWAIWQAAQLLKNKGFTNFYIEAGGDIQLQGGGPTGKGWNIGIKNPFNTKEVIKVVCLAYNEGIATSGIYERGAHIYNPKNRQQAVADIVSLTVIGPNIYEADRFATAAFAMSAESPEKGLHFIGSLPGFHAYAIDKTGKATMTAGFQNYVTTH